MPTIPSVPIGLADLIGDEKQAEEKENNEVEIDEENKVKLLGKSHNDDPIHKNPEVNSTFDNLQSSPPSPKQQQQQPAQRFIISPKNLTDYSVAKLQLQPSVMNRRKYIMIRRLLVLDHYRCPTTSTIVSDPSVFPTTGIVTTSGTTIAAGSRATCRQLVAAE